MFQPIRAIARTLLVPAAVAAVALTSQSAASTGALPTSHVFMPGSGAVAAGTSIHFASPRSHW